MDKAKVKDEEVATMTMTRCRKIPVHLTVTITLTRSLTIPSHRLLRTTRVIKIIKIARAMTMASRRWQR